MPSHIKVEDTTDYIQKMPASAQPHLQQLYHLITTTLPTATPKIKWNLPFFELNSKSVTIAAYKAHVSLSVSVDLTPSILTAAKAAGYATGQKRLNITFDQAVPVTLVQQILALIG